MTETPEPDAAEPENRDTGDRERVAKPDDYDESDESDETLGTEPDQ
jgi:hypothetical protein